MLCSGSHTIPSRILSMRWQNAIPVIVSRHYASSYTDETSDPPTGAYRQHSSRSHVGSDQENRKWTTAGMVPRFSVSLLGSASALLFLHPYAVPISPQTGIALNVWGWRSGRASGNETPSRIAEPMAPRPFWRRPGWAGAGQPRVGRRCPLTGRGQVASA